MKFPQQSVTEKEKKSVSKIAFVNSSDVFFVDPEIVEQIKQSPPKLQHAFILFKHLFFHKLLFTCSTIVQKQM